MQVQFNHQVQKIVTYGLRERSKCDHCGRRRVTTGVGVRVAAWVLTDRPSTGVIFIGRLCAECADAVEVTHETH
jgi:hypothetical protein